MGVELNSDMVGDELGFKFVDNLLLLDVEQLKPAFHLISNIVYTGIISACWGQFLLNIHCYMCSIILVCS